MNTPEKITLGKPVMSAHNSIRLEDGEPFLWEVNGMEGVCIRMERGIEERYYVTDEGRDRPASEHPWYATVEAALDSLRFRKKRIYVGKSWYPKDVPPLERRLQVEFWEKPKSARYYETAWAAEADCQSIFRRGIETKLPDGRTRVLTDFKVEQIGPKEYVIYCEDPFRQGNKK
jgi:hypothetical protein